MSEEATPEPNEPPEAGEPQQSAQSEQSADATQSTGTTQTAPEAVNAPAAVPVPETVTSPEASKPAVPPQDLPGADALAAGPAVEDAEESADRPRGDLPRVIAVANQKGGVGKTTTTINVGACLAELGHRTLIIDLDPQANATTGLGIDHRSLGHSLYNVVVQQEPIDDCIEPTGVPNLFVVPSAADLAGAEIELVPVMSREHRLRQAIDSVLDDFDYVLIDCPPSLGLLTVNALTAAREVLVPIQTEYFALEGLAQLLRNVDLVKANLNPTLEVTTIVLVMYDARTKLAGQVVDEVRNHFGNRVCVDLIPRTVRLSEAPSYGQPITVFDSSSRGAEAYRAVTKEIAGVTT